MAYFPMVMSRRLFWALGFSFVAFIVWLIPSYIVMSPDNNYTERVIREAELVAAAIARGGMTQRPSSKIGDPKDPRIIAARSRSPFHRNRAEGILRQMRTIINKRIVLYDHRRRIFLDSANFDLARRVDFKALPDISFYGDTKAQKPLPAPNYLIPPNGNNGFVLAALGGRSVSRQTSLRFNQNDENDKRFRPKQPILQVAVPVRRLKLVQGAVVLIDNNIKERVLWRWRSLLQDSGPVFVAVLVSLLLLLLWLKGALVNPITRLAYSAESGKFKHNDELSMLSQRQELGQLAVQNFAYAAKFFKGYKNNTSNIATKQKLADAEMASQIHNVLIGAKLETTNLTSIVQRVVNRQNNREREQLLRKMGKETNNQSLPFKDKVNLEKIKANGIHNAWNAALFAESFEMVLDYLVQSASIAQSFSWPNSVRINLIRQKGVIEILIEDDGEDIKDNNLTDWFKRSSTTPNPITQKALEKVVAMHLGNISIPSLRPPCFKLTVPVSPTT